MVAVRLAAEVLAPAAQFMVASPTPDIGDVSVSHVWSIETVHRKVESLVVSENDPVPPMPGTVAADRLIVAVVAACRTPADCVTVKLTFGPRDGFTVIVAVRELACGFGAATYEKPPFPVPVPDEIVNHD
jgi:hypothetical protein